MTTILIVCGAGASSTFLASRMRSIAASRGLSYVIQATNQIDVKTQLAGADILLVGPHLGSEFDSLDAIASGHEVAAALLPATAFGPTGADAAVDLVMGLIPVTAPTPTPLNKGTSNA